MTREEAANIIHIDPRYLTNIENKGQHPSLQIFHKIVTLFNLSVDEFFYPNVKPVTSTQRKQIDNLLDKFNDNELIVIKAVANGIIEAKESIET